MKRLRRTVGYVAEAGFIGIIGLALGTQIDTALLCGIIFMLADIGAGIAGAFDELENLPE